MSEMTLKEFARAGGRARAKTLTKEQRTASARKAAQARWANRPPSKANSPVVAEFEFGSFPQA